MPLNSDSTASGPAACAAREAYGAWGEKKFSVL